eukprot:CAMPEP_0176339234 /NCGR_PEP_ID=MMETSP0126-20121128/607_1 /TAXON_ID=141414 ORGANISM="Strombidinopsis acuminatum, Strain SPMC142" /NCGR_SAMPLE_ID=MMETSP0126 /ASSEMBLY_ACC=CAM_ASM_000229 /LENGTH=65 /DNA_ID=CAMNT_0017682713 /DNA_START=1114 /DNA_END=1311 /DNA_ORIENTATION=+
MRNLIELEITPKIKTPFLMILAGQEQLVCNNAAKTFFEMTEVEDKDLVEYDDADHSIPRDNEYVK